MQTTAPPPGARPRRRRQRREFWPMLSLALAFVVLTAGAITMAVPLLWMVSTSLKNLAEANSFPPEWIPSQPRWGNYREIFERVPFARFIFNSFKVTLLGVVGQLLTTSMAGFVFARLHFRGRDPLFILLLATL